MSNFVLATPREEVIDFYGIDEPLDKVIRIVLGDVKVPDIDFKPYQSELRKNVLIHILFDCTKEDPPGPDMALIKYLPGAFTPRHLHTGYEVVFVLQGEYIENDVLYKPGSLIVRAPGTTHEMRSDTGATFLAMRATPVKQLT